MTLHEPWRELGVAVQEAAVETHELRKAYGDGHVALDGVSIRVRRGSVYGLAGPNGSGKTTLLSILAGLRRPTGGTFAVDAPPRGLALLPDTPNFEPWLSAFEVVDLARALVAPQLSRNEVSTVLVEAGLGDAVERRVGGFSRGMLQRLGVAATLIGDPQILLLDEPCSALDPQGRREILDLLAAQRGRRTVVFSSHILGDVQEVCDDIGIMRNGHLLYEGPLHTLLAGEGTPRYRLRLRSGGEAVAAALRTESWVSNVTSLAPSELLIAPTSIEAAERELVRVLAQTNAAVISLRPEEASLEHVFLELTR